MNNIQITKANYLNDYRIQLQFATNEKMTVSLEKFLDKPEFSTLQDKDIFKNFKIENGNLVWENGTEITALFLYGLPNDGEMSCV